MGTEEHFDIQVTNDSVGVTQPGFGTLLGLTYNAPVDFTERRRVYGSYNEVLTDFPSTTGPEATAARIYFSQTPKPRQFIIGRGALKPTQKYTVSVATVRNSHNYIIEYAGDGVTSDQALYASDSATTAAEIHSGLVTDLNTAVGKNFTAAFTPLVFADIVFTADNATEIFTSAAHGLQTGDGPFQVSNSGGALPTGLLAVTNYWVIRIDANTFYLAISLANALAGTNLLISTNGTGTQTLADTVSTVRPSDAFIVTGDAAGEWFSLKVSNVTDLTIAQSHVDPGVATDLAAIADEDADFFGVTTFYNSELYVKGVAAWVEAQKNKFYIADISESITVTAVSDGTQGVADDLKTLSDARTACIYHPAPGSMIAAGWFGTFLTYDPGKVNTKWKQIAGVDGVRLTSTHKTNLRAKKCNTYENMGGVTFTWEGTRADGGFIDNQRNDDWLEATLAARLLAMFVATAIVPFTDEGIAQSEAVIRGVMDEAVVNGVAAAGTVVITVPLAVEVPEADRLERTLPDIKIAFRRAGAINKLSPVNVVVSV